MPLASRAAWKIAGLIECPSGWPMTPARFTVSSSLALRPGWVEGTDVLPVLLQRLGEGVAAVRPGDEEQEVRLRRPQRRQDRVETRVRDRAGRQPYVNIRII